MKPQIVKFREWLCYLDFRWYADNDRLAILLFDQGDSSPIAYATVNIPEYDLPPNEVIIKDYSENEGMLKTMVESGLMEYTGNKIQTGFVRCPVCKLDLSKLPKKIANKIRRNYEAWQEEHEKAKE